jgi:hypothetical protein
MSKIIYHLIRKIMKLNLEALKERAEAIASEELLESIAGGIMEACHDSRPADPVRTVPCDNI